MPLTTGTRLGPYEIQSQLGAGGMGEVYKARDTRLDRTVAIKVLPEHVAADPDLKQRFEREAKTISSVGRRSRVGGALMRPIGHHSSSARQSRPAPEPAVGQTGGPTRPYCSQMRDRFIGCPPLAARRQQSPSSWASVLATGGPSSCPMASTFCIWHCRTEGTTVSSKSVLSLRRTRRNWSAPSTAPDSSSQAISCSCGRTR